MYGIVECRKYVVHYLLSKSIIIPILWLFYECDQWGSVINVYISLQREEILGNINLVSVKTSESNNTVINVNNSLYRKELRVHKLSVHNDVWVKYDCYKCVYLLTQKENSWIHNLSVHADVWVKYDCYKCEYQLTHKGNLRVHKLSVHKEVWVESNCYKCLYQFTQKGNRRVHKFS